MRKLITLLLLTNLTLSAWGQVSSFDHFGTINIGALQKQAEASLDLANQDAVYLFDGCERYVQDDGRLTTTIHQIIWLGTDLAVETYADYHIRYDSGRQKLETLLLRTWRDGKFIDSDSTARVETLPYGLEKAPDYADLRDMVLMHDGIELPSIIETAYRIEDLKPYPQCVEGAWSFGRFVPVVRSEFRFSASGTARVKALNGAPSPELPTDKITERGNWAAVMTDLRPLPKPYPTDPLKETPHLLYSTFRDWKQLGTMQRKVWDERLVVSDTIKDSISTLIKDTPAMTEKARLVAEYAASATRLVEIEDAWTRDFPRHPNQVYETAYGNRFERALLAAVMFKAAGFEVFPFYRGQGWGAIEMEAATFSQLEPLSVWVSGTDRVEAWYNPETGEFLNGLTPVFGRAIWIPGSGDDPAVSWQGLGTISRFDLRLELEAAEEGKGYKGSGYFYADNGLCPFELLEGVGDKTTDFLTEAVSGVLPEAEVTGFNPATFNRFQVELGFEFTLPIPKADRFDRTVFELGEPEHSISSFLPSASALTNQTRSAVTRLPGRMIESVEIVLPLDSAQTIYYPKTEEVKTEAGSYTVTVRREDGKLFLRWEFSLEKSIIPTEKWGELRKLALAYQSGVGKKVVAKKTDSAD